MYGVVCEFKFVQDINIKGQETSCNFSCSLNPIENLNYQHYMIRTCLPEVEK